MGSRALIYRGAVLAGVRRRWAATALAGGIAAWVVTAGTFLVDIGDHDIAEGIGLLAFVIGLLLVWEGGFALFRFRALAARDKPK